MRNKISQWKASHPLTLLKKQYSYVKEDLLVWNHKPILKGSFLVWDVENISLKRFSNIQALVKFTPEKLYAISKRPLHHDQICFFQSKGFIFFENYPMSADEKIMDLIRIHQGYTHLVLLSSDSDFVPSIHCYLKKHYVHWIMEDANKKRICMNINLSHPRLILSCLYTLERKTSCKKIKNLPIIKKEKNHVR